MQRPDGRDDGGASTPPAPPSAMPIPGARAAGEDPRWQVMVSSASVTASMDLDASLQDGFFGVSLRRHATDHGTYGSLGHGAWLSSSPHPASLRGGLAVAAAQRPPLGARSASLRRQTSGGSGVLSPGTAPDQAPATSLAAAATAPPDLEAARSGVQEPPSPLSPRSASAQSGRPQRWHLGPHGAHSDSAAAELAEPLLPGEASEGAAPLSPAASAATALEPGKSEGAEDGGLDGVPAQPALVPRGPSGGDQSSTDLSRALVFGMINSVATIPSLVAYAAIVFKHPTYTPYLDQLCKFFFLSSAVHQAVFCLLSTLPFSVGQVQDVGLIFLSAMGSSIAAACTAAGRDAATALGTALLTMSVATFFTGAACLLVAKQKLAQMVQYLPLPVIGGYLSFVGYFCLASGVGLGTSLDIGSLASWARLLSWDAAAKLAPTLASCAAMIATLERCSHPLALPGVLVAINLAFHAVRLALGVTMEQAMDAQWVIRPAEGVSRFWELWDLFNIHDLSLSGIFWPALTDQWVKMLGLALVVIFGSAMDIAAIQQDTPKKIDFNRELVTVAVSNMATGVAGCGYTGSYIFSQTIFTMRAGVYNRWNGWVVAISEFVMFALPFPVIQWMPNFFFGALLIWFGVSISHDWLVLSFTKMTRTEYGLLLATFGAIMQWGLEGGILAGIVLATLYFAAAYAQSQVQSIRVAEGARSSVVRTVEQQAALDVLSCKMAAVSLNGFVFFGSANSIGQRLQEEAERLGGRTQEQAGVDEAVEACLRIGGESFAGAKHEQAVAALAAAPSHLLLDFRLVRGLDATGARTMGMVYSDLLQQGVVLVLAGLDHHRMRPLLAAHGLPLPAAPLHWPPELAAPPTPAQDSPGSVRGSRAGLAQGADALGPQPGSLAAGHAEQEGQGPASLEEQVAAGCLEFATLEEALRYCEDQLLEVAVRHGLCQPPSALLPLGEMLRSHLEKLPVGGGLDPGGAAAAMQRYMSEVTLSAGQLLWRVDDLADEMYIIEKGAVRVDEFVRVGEEGGGGGRSAAGPLSGGGSPSFLLLDRSGSGRRVLARSFELGPGCVAGSTAFYLARPHATRALCRSPSARVLRVTRSALERMAAEAPQALNVLQAAVMRANTLDLSQAAEQHARAPHS